MDTDMKWIISVATIVVIGVVWALWSSIAYTNRLMDDCMKDHKEYECYAMIQKSDSRSTTYVQTVRH